MQKTTLYFFLFSPSKVAPIAHAPISLLYQPEKDPSLNILCHTNNIKISFRGSKKDRSVWKKYTVAHYSTHTFVRSRFRFPRLQSDGKWQIFPRKKQGDAPTTARQKQSRAWSKRGINWTVWVFKPWCSNTTHPRNCDSSTRRRYSFLTDSKFLFKVVLGFELM